MANDEPPDLPVPTEPPPSSGEVQRLMREIQADIQDAVPKERTLSFSPSLTEEGLVRLVTDSIARVPQDSVVDIEQYPDHKRLPAWLAARSRGLAVTGYEPPALREQTEQVKSEIETNLLEAWHSYTASLEAPAANKPSAPLPDEARIETKSDPVEPDPLTPIVAAESPTKEPGAVIPAATEPLAPLPEVLDKAKPDPTASANPDKQPEPDPPPIERAASEPDPVRRAVDEPEPPPLPPPPARQPLPSISAEPGPLPTGISSEPAEDEKPAPVREPQDSQPPPVTPPDQMTQAEAWWSSLAAWSLAFPKQKPQVVMDPNDGHAVLFLQSPNNTVLHDYGKTILSSENPDDHAILLMVEAAKKNGWKKIHFTGGDAHFRNRVYLEAKRQHIEVAGGDPPFMGPMMEHAGLQQIKKPKDRLRRLNTMREDAFQVKERQWTQVTTAEALAPVRWDAVAAANDPAMRDAIIQTLVGRAIDQINLGQPYGYPPVAPAQLVNSLDQQMSSIRQSIEEAKKDPNEMPINPMQHPQPALRMLIWLAAISQKLAVKGFDSPALAGIPADKTNAWAESWKQYRDHAPTTTAPQPPMPESAEEAPAPQKAGIWERLTKRRSGAPTAEA